MNSQNTNLPAERREQKAQVVAGGQIAAIVPQTLDEAFRLANAIAISGLAPSGMNRPEQVMVAILAGAELGLAPFQAVQSFAVVNGRPSIWGDAIPALLWSRGFKIKEWYENESPDFPDAMVARCEVTRPDGTVVPGEFSVRDAKDAGLWTKAGTWQTAKKRMLKMRARAFAARDGAADVLRGAQVREEVEDYQHVRDVTPRGGTGMRDRYEARQVEPTGGFDPAHIEAELRSALPEALKRCEVCGAAEGVECSDECASWDELDPSSWPDGVREHRARSMASDGGTADEPAEAPDEIFPGDRDVIAWATELSRSLDRYESVDALNAVTDDAESIAKFDALQSASPGTAKALAAAITGRRKALAARASS